MTPAEPVRTVYRCATTLGEHPQDHGWRELYRLFAFGLKDSAPALTRLVDNHLTSMPQGSPSHFVTLLGIAVKAVAGDTFTELVSRAPIPSRLVRLEQLLTQHGPAVARLLTTRRNSFTGVRRFLVPQVLLAAYFADGRYEVNFADLGTGLGIMPCQLNSRTLYERLSPDLSWPDGFPAFREIPLAARFGVERAPMPDLNWVATCYGASPYYSRLWDELLSTLSAEDLATSVRYALFDLTDEAMTASFLRRHRINCVNLCYSLYELTPPARARTIASLWENLYPPKVIIVAEPHGELARPGCDITFYDETTPHPQRICEVSDGHFVGRVAPLADYAAFVGEHPILFAAATEPA